LTALKTLEEAFDNLPVPLIPALIENVAADSPTIAVGADARTRGFAIESMLATLDDVVGRTSRELKLLFIDCDDDRLERRYTQSRRPHPLAGDRLVIGGIRLERQVLSALRDCADLVIDTSNFTLFCVREHPSSRFRHIFFVSPGYTTRCRSDFRRALPR